MTTQFFDEVLAGLIEQSGLPLPRLAKLSSVSQKTIESWLEGRVKRPRTWHDLARVATVMHLKLPQINALLAAAKHKTIDQLLAEAQRTADQEGVTILAFWATARAEPIAESPRQPPAIFLAPPALTKLIGRESEYAALKGALLAGGGICVLRGMSGTGKTALALQAAHELTAAFPDGVLWGALDKSSPTEILRLFAQAYGKDVSEDTDQGTLSAHVHNIFANKRALIILDSAHEAEAVALLLPPVAGGTAVIITTTSYKLLEYATVTTLELKPFDRAHGLAFMAEHLQAYPHDAQDDLAQIIDLVNGLPLALKIIASNLPTAMTMHEYYEMLRDEELRYDYLYDDDEARQHVRTSFGVSYKLLRGRWQKLISCLSLFKGIDFSVKAVAAVIGLPVGHVQADLDRLHDLSLIEPSGDDTLTPLPVSKRGHSEGLERYRQHTLLAFFGAEKLKADFPELLPGFQQRIASYYADYIQEVPDQFPLLEREWGNLAAALPWLRDQGSHERFAQSIAALTKLHLGVAGFLDGQGHWRTAIHWLEAIQKAGEITSDRVAQATVHMKLGLFHLRLAEREQAEHHLQKAQTILATVPENAAAVTCQAYAYEAQAQLLLVQGLAEQAGDHVNQGIAALKHFQNKELIQTAALSSVEGYLLVRHATIVARTGKLDMAQVEIEDALKKLPPESEPTAARVSALLTLGNIYDLQGKAAQAKECFLAGVDAATAIGDNRRLADLWRNLAIHAEEAGDFATCVNDNKTALDLYRRIGDVVGQGSVASNLSVNYLRQGKPEAALSYIQETRRIADAHHVAHLGIYANVNLAHYHLLRAEYMAASRLLTEAHGQSEQLGESETLAEILRLQAQVAHQQGAYEQALQLIKESIENAGANEWEADASRQVQAAFLADQQISSE